MDHGKGRKNLELSIKLSFSEKSLGRVFRIIRMVDNSLDLEGRSVLLKLDCLLCFTYFF